MTFKNLSKAALAAVLIAGGLPAVANAETAYLEITLQVAPADRPAAGAIYAKYKKPFLTKVKGARSKQLLIRDEDVQVLHGFDSVKHANDYLKSQLFNADVVRGLKPLLQAAPEVRIYKSN